MFYQNIQMLAKARGTTPTGVANAIGLANSSATKWKRGAVPKADTLQKIAEYLGVTTDLLLSEQPMQANVTGDVSSSAVVQGGSGNRVSVSNGIGGDATEQEIELLRIFRALDMKGKTAVMSCAYEQEERNATK